MYSSQDSSKLISLGLKYAHKLTEYFKEFGEHFTSLNEYRQTYTAAAEIFCTTCAACSKNVSRCGLSEHHPLPIRYPDSVNNCRFLKVSSSLLLFS
jgi:hypothetical protein